MNDILAILVEIRPEADFATSQDYIADGLLDSFDVVTLVSTLDEKYGISIEGTDIVPENFQNFKAIVSLLVKCGIKF